MTIGPQSYHLMEAFTTTKNQADCQSKWGSEFDSSQMICAYGSGGSCKGDSGGPLVCGNTAVGVTSFGDRYLCNSPARPNVGEKLSVMVGAHDHNHGTSRMEVKFYHIHPGYESKSLLHHATSGMVCAGGRGGLCQGDSGGPLV
ncbi:unnamed protein product [Leuciscus chuanchicus]